MRKLFYLICTIMLAVAFSAQANVAIKPDANMRLYVKKDATGNRSGGSWENAIPELATALDYAKDVEGTGDAIIEIWVAKGEYKPLFKAGSGNEEADNAFVMVKGVALYGGFAGDEDMLEKREVKDDSSSGIYLPVNTTTLSGDLGNGNNAYHVVIAVGDIGVACLDGFEITGGKAEGSGSITVDGYDVPRNKGGGIYVSINKGYLAIFNNSIYENNAANYGGGLFVNNSTQGVSSTVLVIGNLVHYNNAESGAGVSIISNNTSTTATNVVHSNNIYNNEAAQDGAGLYINTQASHDGKVLNNIGSNNIYNNTTTRDGAGLYINNQVLDSGEVTNRVGYNKVYGNKADNNGAGIYINTNATDNSADYSYSYSYISSNEVYNNVAANNGAGIYTTNTSMPSKSKVHLFENDVHDNTAAKAGGGIYAYDNGSTEIERNRIGDNLAATNGGGVYISSIGGVSSVKVINNYISSNSASANGGGLYIYSNTYYDPMSGDGSSITNLINNVLYKNMAASGGGIYISASSIGDMMGGYGSISKINLTNNSLYGNFASTSGAGIYAYAYADKDDGAISTINIHNSIIWGNTLAGSEEENNITATVTQGDIFLQNSLIGEDSAPQNVTDKNNNIYGKDPLFGDVVEGELYLLSGSPAIDAGSDDLYTATGRSLTDPDMVGEIRKQGDAINMGAYEKVVLNEVEAPENNHTLTLTIGAGITANYGSGELTVPEGESLRFTFLPDNRDIKADGIILTVDGVETPFNDLGGDYHFTYTLNDIVANHTVTIALRTYTVTMPSIEGVTTDPVAGSHQVPYGQPFTFTLTLTDDYDQSDVRILVNGSDVTPTLRSTVYTVTIDRVTEPVNISILGVKKNATVGNADIASGNVELTVDNGQLTIDSTDGKAMDVNIYNLRGQVVAQRKVIGSGTFTLPAGFYLVRVGGETHKIVINY